MSGFDDLGLLPELVQAVTDMGWYLPRAVQAEAIPLILGGGHVLCAAETGSGKTGAFCLPLLQVTWENLRRARRDPNGDPGADAAQAGSGGPLYKRCVLSSEDCNTNAKISLDGLLCQCHSPRGWSGVRCSFGVGGANAKWYYEAKVIEYEGIVRVGWSTPQASLELGTDALGWGYGGTGKKSNNKQFDDYGGAFGLNDVIGCGVDVAAGEVTFFKNGQPLGVAFVLPDALRAALASGSERLHPAICVKNSQVRLAFSRAAITALPAGFAPVDDAAGADQDTYQRALRSNLHARNAAAAQNRRPGPTSLVLEPTLELAAQVVEETLRFAANLHDPEITICSISGKREHKDMVAELKHGPHVVIGTPGRIESLVDSGDLQLSNLRFLIVDEADRIADDNVGLILKLWEKAQASNGGRTQFCMFSATLHTAPMQALSNQICPTAIWIDLKGRDYVPESVYLAVVHVDPKENPNWRPDPAYRTDHVHDGEEVRGDVAYSLGTKHLKVQMLLRLIEVYNMSQCMIFCRTRVDCDELSHYLNAKGAELYGGATTAGRGTVRRTEKGRENVYSNVVLHSGMANRAENLEMFKEGDVRFLICTDVAARGIDIEGLPYVVNMTLPDRPEDFIHRIGRTGRAERMGLAISIVSRTKEKVWYHTCPNRGQGCSNRNVATLMDNGQYVGGCCIWYNEPECELQVMRRAGRALEELDPVTLTCPTLLDPSQYGRARAEAEQLAGLTPQQQAVAEHLAALDTSVQKTFLRNKMDMAAVMARFHKVAA